MLNAVIVDDTPDIRMLMRLALELEGDFQVVDEAGNGRDGVEAVRRSQPDVVLLDMSMPIMDGLEALPLIKEACPSARVVVVSGFETASMAEPARKAGADGYLQKGASPTQILAYVREVVGA